jgi:hypothetical protein
MFKYLFEALLALLAKYHLSEEEEANFYPEDDFNLWDS